MVTMKLSFVIIASLLVPESRGQGQCDSDTDCQDPLPCCSQYNVIYIVSQKMSLSCLGPLEKVTFFMGHCA